MTRRPTSAGTAAKAIALRERREVREQWLQRGRDNAADRKLKRQLRAERIKAGVDATITPSSGPLSAPYLPQGLTRRDVLGQRLADALGLPRQPEVR